MRFPLVLATGAIIGAILCLVLGMTFPAAIVGALVGASSAFALYDPAAIRAQAPGIASRTFARSRGLVTELRSDAVTLVHWLIIPRFVAGAYLLVGTLVTYLIGSGSMANVWSLCLSAVATLGVTVMLGVATGLLMDVTEELWEVAGELPLFGESWKSHMRRLSRKVYDRDDIIFGGRPGQYSWTVLAGVQLRMLFDIAVSPVICLLSLAKICLRICWAVPCAVGEWLLLLAMLVSSLAIATGRFAWRLFVEVHEEKQRMAFVDSAAGLLVGYSGLRVAYGAAFLDMPAEAKLSFVALSAALAVAFGLFNCHVVATRFLKLTPA